MNVGMNPHDRIEAKEKASVLRISGDIMHLSDDNISTRNITIDQHSSSAAKQMYSDGKPSNYLRILFKPFLRFFTEYFIKLGFLDGFYGFYLARSNAFYVFLREMKLKELWSNKEN